MADGKTTKNRLPSFGILSPPPHQDGDYLKTLAEWGALPEIVPIPNAARLLALLCAQNPKAILKVIQDAVLGREIDFFGLSHDGGWRQDMMRVFHPFTEKPRLSFQSEGVKFAMRFDVSKGAIHWEAMGIRPGDAVALLRKRGRKIPPDLANMYPDHVSTPSPGETAPNDWKKTARDIGERWMLEQERKTGKRPTAQQIANYVADELSNRDIRGPRGKYPDPETVKREALTGITGRKRGDNLRR